jgi:hypothetical protein
MKEKLLKIIKNNSSTELNLFINRFFNGNYQVFFNTVIKSGLLDDEEYRDEVKETLIEVFPMNYLSTIYNNNSEETTRFIVNKYFGDVNETGDGRYLLRLNDREDLSNFFKGRDGGRNDLSSKEMAKLIFQEDWWEPFNDLSYDLYNDIIEELNPENLQLLAEKINDELSNTKIDPETDLLENIAEEQGHPEYVELDTNIILNEIFKDEETIKYILENYSTTISSDLSNLYNNASNTVYVDEKWEDATNELKSFFLIDNIGKWDSRVVKNYKGEEKTVHDYKIEVTNFLPYMFKKMFDDEYIMDDSHNVFEYYGELERLIIFLIDEDIIEGGTISMSHYDYPDHSKTVKYINDLFADYI